MCAEEALLAQDRSKEAQDGRKLALGGFKRTTCVTFWLHSGQLALLLRPHGAILGLLGPILGLLVAHVAFLGPPWTHPGLC